MITFQKDGSQVLESNILDVYKICISKGQRNNLYCTFFKVNSLRKGILGACGQEETFLKFSQSEGNVKTILVTPCSLNKYILV